METTRIARLIFHEKSMQSQNQSINVKYNVSPCMPNGISYFYRLDESISNFRVLFIFIQISIENSVSKLRGS